MDKCCHGFSVTRVRTTERIFEMLLLHMAMAWWWEITHPAAADERGLSQSTENAILLAGAVAVAVLIVTVITSYVQARLPS